MAYITFASPLIVWVRIRSFRSFIGSVSTVFSLLNRSLIVRAITVSTLSLNSTLSARPSE